MSDLIRRQDVLRICDKYNGQGWVWSMIRKEVDDLPCDGCCTAHSGYEADAISREDAIQAVNNTLAEYIPYFRSDQIGIPLECARALNDLPSVTQEPKTGRWIYDRTRDWDGECKYECSECGMGSDVDYAYCMRCGARMVEPQEREISNEQR